MKPYISFPLPVLGWVLMAITLARGLHAADIASGENQTGQLAANGVAEFTFQAQAGDSVVLRAGTTNFVPRVQLYGPGLVLVGTVANNTTVNRDAELMLQLTNSGTFTARLDSLYAGGAGGYGVRLAVAPGSFTVPTADEGGPLSNGGRHSGVVELGDLDLWSFDAMAGNGLQLRMGANGFVPRLRVYGPGGALVFDAYTSTTVNRDAQAIFQATNSGTYLAVGASLYGNGNGTYELSFVKSPGAIVIAANDEGGPLTNGVTHGGTINTGELDAWSFDATTGQTIHVRMGATGFVPRLDLYGPDGSLLATGFTTTTVNRDAELRSRATNSGTFTLVASSLYFNGAGNYSLNSARIPGDVVVMPGDDGGPLTNGYTHSANLALGDLDSWTFSAVAGQSIQVRMGATGFVPRMDLYGPDGTLLISAYTTSTVNRDAQLALQLTNSGVFTLVASSTYFNGDGDYILNFARVPDEIVVLPGDDGGPLTNGWTHTGELGVGDLDSWTFTTGAGSSIELRVGSPSLVPRIDLYGPSGTLLGTAATSSTVNRDAHLTARTTNEGTFTVVVSGYYLNDSGAYTLTLADSGTPVAVSPGDHGGSLTNGWVNAGTNVLGDLEVWRFHGTVGDSNVFRIGTAGYTPRLRLYGPEGELLGDAYVNSTVNRTNFLIYVVTNEGPHTIVASSHYANGSGTYNFKQSRVPPDLVMPSLVTVDEGGTLNVPIYANDPDAPNNTLLFLLVSGPPGAQVVSQGPTNAVIQWPTSEADGPRTNVISASVTDVVNGRPFIRTNSITVVVNEINTPPFIEDMAQQSVAELSAFSFMVTASDADVPANTLSYGLASAPAGMTIDSETGLIQWTPAEVDGPGTNTVVVTVTDNNPWAANEQHLSATNSFILVVREVNTRPQIQAASRQQADELSPFSFAVVATDADLPPNPLNYQVLAAPAGLAINPTTGVLSWTPGESQGPSTNLITVVVRDQSPSAEQPQLWATNTIEVVVHEVNSAPQVQAASSQAVDELTPFLFNVIATDADEPPNTLTYEILGAPTGLSINPATGAINWTPSEAQGPSTNVLNVVVSDQSPLGALRATNTVEIVVREVNTPPSFSLIERQSVRYGTSLSVNPSWEDSDLPANSVSFALVSGPTNLTVDATSGAIAWVPAANQLGTHEVVIRVLDDGVPGLSGTNTFQVVVTGVEPQLAIQQLAGGLMQISIIGDTGLVYDLEHSADLTTWASLVRLNVPSSPYPYIDPGSIGPARRYYRVRIVP